MATQKQLSIDIFPDGSVKIEAEGYKDSTCLKATEDLEKALGTVKNRVKKTEALRMPVGANATVKVGGK